MALADQGYTAYGARLLTSAKPGGVGDESIYIARPGIDFFRPWLAVENDIAFQWPGGVQGFSFTSDPVLGTHTYIGDDKVVLDVLNAGAEALTLSGSFAGDSSPSLFQALRAVVARPAPNGKILYLPEIMASAQRVQVSHFESSRADTDRGRTLNYSIDLKITGTAMPNAQPSYALTPTSSTAAPKGTSAATVTVDSAHRTLRQLALWKLKSADSWLQIYTANEAYFINHAIPKSQAPSYLLPIGTKLFL